MFEFELEEDVIITAWALRISGYDYHGMEFDFHKVLDDFYRTGRFPASDTEKLVTLFFMQRSFRMGEGEFAPENGKFWRAYRMLFLEIYDLEIPEELTLSGFYKEWQANFEPRKEECAAFVRDIHNSTSYDDNAQQSSKGFRFFKAE
jgi:hypothetical protein